MNQEEKKNIDSKVLNLINSLVETNSLKDCVLYVRGDAEFQNAVFLVKGNAALIANTIIHHIEKNVGFSDLILSTVGSHLAKNPEPEKEFMRGIELLKLGAGMN